MSYTDSLNHLASLVGIEDGWWDFFGTWRVVPEETKKAFLTAMGFTVETEEQVGRAIADHEARPWKRWLEPVMVIRDWDQGRAIDITLPAERDNDVLFWQVEEEMGAVHDGRFTVRDLEWGEERWIEGQCYHRRRFRLPGLPPPGYHRFRLRADDGRAAAMTLIVAPSHAFSPDCIQDGRKVWGVATQVYSLRRPDDWGLGDYGALRDLCSRLGGLGASTVGVNPLHALFANRPDRFSPYAPSSRQLVNVLYLDIEAIPDFADCDEARSMVAESGFQAALAKLRGRSLIDYPAVAACKRPALEALYRWFRAHHLSGSGGAVSDRGRAFRRYQEQSGRDAELFAIFEAVQEHFMTRDANLGYWRHWPVEYRDPKSPAVTEFAINNRARVEFFWYLQWLADEQLAAVQETCCHAGMGIGLYRDLGVGIADDGAEAWIEQDLLAQGVTVGAPPDPLNLKGQDWGLAPYNPLALREAAYRPFIAMLSANMSHAGALRLDHAMSLQRLYWVPRGLPADQGAYVRLPVDDLFGLVALESRRRRCMVIGEDLGTVPEGFRERMGGSNVYGYRLMVFEKHGDGGFKRPWEIQEHALVALVTHDFPSFVGWWDGIDVEARTRLNLYPRPDMAGQERSGRAEERRRIKEAFQQEGLLPEDFPIHSGLNEEQAEQLVRAAHEYINRAPSKLMMVQLEDVLGLVLQMNLPGTVDQHPNWRVRLPFDNATIAGDRRLAALADSLRGSRSPG